jgi:asparagine synthase (glutamine-hydrolysing)
MSVQFGRWNLAGQPLTPGYIEKVSASLAPFGPDSERSYSNTGLAILYRAFCTTAESLRENQPHLSASGAVITWDGRLDNRKELIGDLRGALKAGSTDVDIVAAAYEKWGDKTFAKLTGDWALSVWNPRDNSVLLAKDPIGTKHLYYSFDDHQISWSTLLDPLVLFGGKTFQICEEYVAGWFANNAAAHLTPYRNVHTVPPSSFVLLRRSGRTLNRTVSKYWDFDPGKRVRYRNDGEYAEQFRSLLATAVRRRLRSDRPVLGELSGGLDSSSIVCMADILIAGGQTECPRLDTISWYDDSYDHLEPDSNELRWISKTEEKRGREGHHINFGKPTSKGARSQEAFGTKFSDGPFAATPFPRFDSSNQFLERGATHLGSQGYRVSLSGIGGSEFGGGDVPDPTLELQDLVAQGQFVKLALRLSAWASKMRQPRLPLLRRSIKGFFSAGPFDEVDKRSIPWLDPRFVRRNQAALLAYVPSRVKLFGALPSFQENMAMLGVLRRLMANNYLVPQMLREVRYPYLDRDLLEFLFAVPREQVVGLGKRRFMMKNAIAGIIPDEVLNRRPKRFVPPTSRADKEIESLPWPQLGPPILSSVIGVVDSARFVQALHKPRRNGDVVTYELGRTLLLESWLRHLAAHGVLGPPAPLPRSSGAAPHRETVEQPALAPLPATQQRSETVNQRVSAS